MSVFLSNKAGENGVASFLLAWVYFRRSNPFHVIKGEFDRFILFFIDSGVVENKLAACVNIFPSVTSV